MRELVYLSTAKLDGLEPRSGLAGIGEVEISFAGIGLRMARAGAEGTAGRVPWKRLEGAERRLRGAPDIADAPELEAGRWFTFRSPTAAELPARWLGDLDVVLFACQYDVPAGAEGELAVLLCGSGRHLVGGGSAPDGPAVGSTPSGEWFPEEEPRTVGWRELNTLRAAAETGEPATERSVAEALRPGAPQPDAALWTTYAMHRTVSSRVGPSREAWMRGHARVLASGTIKPAGGARPVRVVLASPLDVEYAR